MAERLTTDSPDGMLYNILNMFRVKDHEVWLEGYGENGEAITLHDFTRKVIRGWDPVSADPLFTGYDLDNDEELDQLMCDCLADGPGTDEGLLAMLYQAAWAFAEIRERLKEYEDREETGRGHAQWKPQAENDGVVFGYQCSRCGALWYFPDGGTPREHNARYCPECGARMDEEG